MNDHPWIVDISVMRLWLLLDSAGIAKSGFTIIELDVYDGIIVAVGDVVGLTVGVVVGAAVGVAVGEGVGLTVGLVVGAAVGVAVGDVVGRNVGAAVAIADIVILIPVRDIDVGLG